MKPRYRLSPPLRRTPAAGALLATLCALTHNAHAATYDWTGTTNNNLSGTATNWSPSLSSLLTTDILRWNAATYTGTTPTANANMNFGQLLFDAGNTNGITFGAGANTLTLNGVSGTGIQMNSGTGAVSTGSAKFALGASQSWTNNDDSLLTVGGTITNADNTTAKTLTINGTGNTTLNGVISNNTNGAVTSITKEGAGTLTLGGNNTFTGDVLINGGIVTVTANGRKLGSIASGSVIVDGSSSQVQINGGNGFGANATTETNRALVAKNGGTILTSGSNVANRIGNVTLQGGTMSINSTRGTDYGAFYLGTVNTGQQATVTVSGGTGAYVNTPSVINFTTGNGNLALDTNTQFDVADVTGNANADLTVSANLILGTLNPNAATGAGFTKKGAGTMALTGTTANTYSGGTTTVTAGVLELGKTNVNAIGGNLTVSGGTAKLTGTGGNQIVNTANLVVSGGTFDLVALSETVNGVQLTSGSITGTSGVLTSNTTYDMRAGTASAILGGGVGLNKTTAGTVTLSGANTYTGATNVNAGVLAVNGSLANTSTTVGNGGTLQGSGSITGSVTVQNGGTLATGNSIESLKTGALELQVGSTFAYELNNDAEAGVAGDLTAVTGNLTLDLTNGAILTLSELGSGSWTAGDKLTLISYTGIWNAGLFNYGGTLADDSTITFSGMDWSFNYNDTAAGTNYTGDLTGSSFVTMTAVPEPRAALLGGLGILMLLRRRRA